MKVDRDYILTVQTGPYGPPQPNQSAFYTSYAQNQATIAPPYTMEFDIERNSWATSQTGTFRIKNLSPNLRDNIYKDAFATWNYATVKLQAGYKGQFLPTIFFGQILEAQSHRDGQFDFVTEINAQDGGFAIANSYSAQVVQPNTSFADAFASLNGDLANTAETPIIGNLPAKALSTRPVVFVGPTFKTIQNTLPPNTFGTIDLGTLKVMAYDDGLQFGDVIFNISADTGLLDPPVRSGNGISCRMLFEPRITLGQQVKLTSLDNTKFNGIYQVMGVAHLGIVSPTESGSAYTTLQLYNQGLISVLTNGVAAQATN